MIFEVTIKGNISLADLQQAINELRKAGCPWEAPVTSATGIDIHWTADATRTVIGK